MAPASTRPAPPPRGSCGCQGCAAGVASTLRSAPACRSARVTSTGQTSALPSRQALQPSFTPRRSEGRDQSASHMTVELCACARAMDSSRGTYKRDVTANPKRLPCSILRLAGTTPRTPPYWRRLNTYRPVLALHPRPPIKCLHHDSDTARMLVRDHVAMRD